MRVNPGVNGTKLRGIWGILLPRRGYRIQPRVSTLGNFNLAVRPHKALPRSALVEKHPSAGLEVLKGRKFAWVNPTHTAHQNGFRVCLAALETPLEKLSCDYGFPGPRGMKKLICWRIG